MDLHVDLNGKSRNELQELAERYEWMMAAIRGELIAIHHRLFMLTEEMDILPDGHPICGGIDSPRLV